MEKWLHKFQVAVVIFFVLIISIFALCVLPLPALAGHLHHEDWYQERWCSRAGGDIEIILNDNTRVDCVTAFHSIEFDFAAKWAEAVGQALHYSRKTGLRAGIVLIIEDEEKDPKYVERVRQMICYYALPIDLWTVTEMELQP